MTLIKGRGEENMSTYIIAEAGVNHNGDINLAKQLIEIAKKAGADAVKFQTFKTEQLVTETATQAKYQVNNLGEATSQFDMLKKLELSFGEFRELLQYCNEIGIEFLSTPFDRESADFLIDELNIKTVKISSGDLTNIPFLYYIARKNKPIIISSGMATVEEIDEALAYICYGLAGLTDMDEVKVSNFAQSEEGQQLLSKYVTLLHCTTEYPAPFNSINLRAINYLQKRYPLAIGLSDHSEGIEVGIAAVALGATVIEKHFTIDRTMEGPDHVASLSPEELTYMVKGIRNIELAMGMETKEPSAIELENRRVARKSLVANCDIQQGELFTESNITVKRPGYGMAPSLYWNVVGQVAKKSYQKDDLIGQ